MLDEELVEKATKMYFRKGNAQQPSIGFTTCTRRRVTLGNVNGILAVFKRTAGRKLMMIR